ncbi:hypothetical protein CLOP_g6013 [Closterium sp. NIES-67]|nr:hypothetical protein CLOP_g6013 [Closterium sp. NIES-67]
MSFMDALRVAAKTKDAPPAWLPNRQWPAELTDPAFSPTVKKRKPCTFEPYATPHLTSLSAPDGAVRAVSSPSCSVSSTKLLVMPSGPFRIDSPGFESSRETTSRAANSESVPPFVRAMTTPAARQSQVPLGDVSPLRLAESPLLRTSTCRAVTRSSLSRNFGNRFGELATSSSEPNLTPDSELQRPPVQLTSFGDLQSSRVKRGFASCNDVTSNCSLSSGSDWVNSSALASSLRGENAGRSVADLIDPGCALVPELGKAVRLLRKKLSQERQHQPRKPPVPLPTTTGEEHKQIRQSSESLCEQSQKSSQKSPVEDPQSSSMSVPTEGNHSRELSLPEILQWEGEVVAKGAGQQPEATSGVNSFHKFPICAVGRAGKGEASSGGAESARAVAEGFGGEVRDEDKLCIHDLLGQISGNYNGEDAVAGAAKGETAESMECDGQVENYHVPKSSVPLPFSLAPSGAEAAPASISASPNIRRKRPPPPPPLVDVANVASAAFAEMCSSEGGFPPESQETAAEPPAAGGPALTPTAGASAAASIAATAELPCPTPTGWGTSQWGRLFPPEPPTPSAMGSAAAFMACAGGGNAGGSGTGGASAGNVGNGGGFASLWSEAWTEGFNVDLSGLTDNPALW